MQQKVKFIGLKKTPLLTWMSSDGNENFTFPTEDQLKDVTEKVQIQTLRLWGNFDDVVR